MGALHGGAQGESPSKGGVDGQVVGASSFG